MYTLKKVWRKIRSYKKSIIEFAIILAIALLFRSVLYEPYLVPSRSMLPTLIEGDRLLISKFYYGISRYSFPFSPPIFKGRIFEFNKPKRGDIIIFETDKVYVKRLIGLPGDAIQMIHGDLYINETVVPRYQRADPFVYNDSVMLPQFMEELPEGHNHLMLDFDVYSEFDNTPLFKVPDDHYFFMGDNRDDSRDSRDMSGIGYVHRDNILGKVQLIFFSAPTLHMYNLWGIIKDFRLDRALKPVS